MAESSFEQKVQPGWWVTVSGFEPETPDEVETYWLVDPSRADVLNNRIPQDTVLAQTLIGNRVGDTVPYQAPTGEYRLRILDAGPA